MKSLNLLKIENIFTRQCLTFLFTHQRVPIFLQNAGYHEIPIRQCHQSAIPYSHTSRARNVLDTTYQLYLEKCHHALWTIFIRIVFTVFVKTLLSTGL